MTHHATGEYIELLWDGSVQEHYVYGHVTSDEFRAEVFRWYRVEADSFTPPLAPVPGAVVTHGWARRTRGPDDDDGNRTSTFEFSLKPKWRRCFEVTRLSP